MEVTMELNFDISVKCSECDATLEVTSIGSFFEGSVDVEVEPCGCQEKYDE